MKKKYLVVIVFLHIINSYSQKNEKEAQVLQEVKIVKQKKAVEQKADRTIFDFASQSNLNSGNVLEGIKKLPGLIVSDVAGMMYQGKQLEVYLDSRPLNISSNELTSYLEGMPANSVEKVEIITQPGAEFPATSGGAIINIITSKTAHKYLTATYSNATNFTNYDKLRTRTNNSILLNAKNKYFGWQLNLGQNYRESSSWTSVLLNNNLLLSNTHADRINRSNFVKVAFTFDLKKDRLIVNYDGNYSTNNAYTIGDGLGFNSNDASNTKVNRQEAVATYQKRFDKPDQKLDFVFNFSRYNNQFDMFSNILSSTTLDNTSTQKYYNFKIDYTQSLKILDEGKFTTGILWDRMDFTTNSFSVTNLNYNRNTQASFVEFQAKLKKMDFIVGTRSENYLLKGTTNTGNLIPFDKFKVFPNASFQYNFMPQIYFNLNYNNKITLPSTSSLNPNNTTYQNPNVAYSGNPQLKPTIFNNYEAKISAFDYAFVSYSVSMAKNQVINRIFQSTGNQLINTSVNVNDVTIKSFDFGFPLPYMLFTKGLKETMKFDVNPDTMNFLYIYTGYQKHILPDLPTHGFWIFNFMSQIILPKKIKFTTNFSYNTIHGNYYYYVGNKPFNQSIDVSFAKKFLNDKLSVSIFCDDVFNTTIQNLSAAQTDINFTNKNDTRRFGFTLSYKLPTKNKLAKEESNHLNKEKKDETTPLGN